MSLEAPLLDGPENMHLPEMPEAMLPIAAELLPSAEAPNEEETAATLQALAEQIDEIFDDPDNHELVSALRAPEGKDTSPGDCQDSDSHDAG